MSGKLKLRHGLKGFAAFLLIAWPASWLVMAAGVVEALPLALFVSVLAWLGARAKPDQEFTIFSASVGFMLVGIGVVGFGRLSSLAKDAGADPAGAAIAGLSGPAGILIGFGLIAIIARSVREKRTSNAQD